MLQVRELCRPRTLTASVSDPDADAGAFRWKVDGVLMAPGTNSMIVPGAHTLEAAVRDSRGATTTAAKELLPLSKSCPLVLLALAVAGCSKVDVERSGWVLGTFSDTPANYSSLTLASVIHYEFREDGTLAVSAVGCGGDQESLLREYQWRSDGDLRVVVEIPAPENTVFQEWVVSPGEDCNTVRIDQIQDHEARSTIDLWRGAVCGNNLGPCDPGYECATCETAWCDGAPPACEE